MISKSPQNIDVLRKPIQFTSSARTAFEIILRKLDFRRKECILLPAYIGINDKEGSGVFDPIMSVGIPFEFYSLTKNLSCNLDEVESKLKKGDIKCMLVIHYFGFPNMDILKIRDLCHAHEVTLVEDCAHTFHSKFNGQRLGEIGDYSFFSIHKNYPSETGGILRSNHGQDSSLQLKEEQKISFEALKVYCTADHNAIAETLKQNYEKLSDSIKDLKGIELMFPKLHEGVVPLNMPLLVGGGKREELYFHLLEKGIPTVALYYRLIEEIEKSEFPLSYEISENIINLPVNQDLVDSDLNRIKHTLEEYLK